MRRDPEYFGEAELDLIYVARTLADALRLETVLDAEGLEYMVETGTYSGGFLIRRDLTGAFFYVAPADLETSRTLMQAQCFVPYSPP